MQGYGFSIWIVPLDHQMFMKKYNMVHIPHITVSTNYTSVLQARETFNKLSSICSFSFHPGYHMFPSMYEYEVLRGSGFYCDVHSIEISHKPHMTVFYNVDHRYHIDEPQNIHYGVIQIADTTSLDPRQWFLVN